MTPWFCSVLGKSLKQKLGFVGRRLVFGWFAATQPSLSLCIAMIWCDAWILSWWGDFVGLATVLLFLLFFFFFCQTLLLHSLSFGKGCLDTTITVNLIIKYNKWSLTAGNSLILMWFGLGIWAGAKEGGASLPGPCFTGPWQSRSEAQHADSFPSSVFLSG